MAPQRTRQMFQPPDQGERYGRGEGGASGGTDDSWLVTWADAITVLLGFFVLLFSLAQLDDARFDEIRQALTSDLKVEDPLPVPIADTRTGPELARRLTELLSAATYSGEVQVERLPAGVVVEMPASGLFDDDAQLRKDAIDTLATFAWEIRQPDMMDYMVEVQAFGDQDVAGLQAMALTRFLGDQGVSSERLRTTSFSDLKPRLRRTRGGDLPHPTAPHMRVLLERP